MTTLLRDAVIGAALVGAEEVEGLATRLERAIEREHKRAGGKAVSDAFLTEMDAMLASYAERPFELSVLLYVANHPGEFDLASVAKASR